MEIPKRYEWPEPSIHGVERMEASPVRELRECHVRTLVVHAGKRGKATITLYTNDKQDRARLDLPGEALLNESLPDTLARLLARHGWSWLLEALAEAARMEALHGLESRLLAALMEPDQADGSGAELTTAERNAIWERTRGQGPDAYGLAVEAARRHGRHPMVRALEDGFDALVHAPIPAPAPAPGSSETEGGAL